MSSSVPYRKSSYRNPNGLRERSESGYGYGTSSREARIGRAREAERAKLVAAEPTDAATAAWGAALDELRPRLSASTVALWIEQMALAGELDGALVIGGPEQVASWLRRRYATALGDAVRQVSDFRGVFICVGEVKEDGGNQCH